MFGDETLNALEAEALAANQDLKAAAARLAQARALEGSARSERLPQIDASFGPTRQRPSPAAQELDDGTLLPFAELDDRGGYAQGVWGFRRRWAAGLRYDWANGDDPADPLRDARRRYSTNVTFYPSEFSKLRLQYSLDDAEHLARDVSTVALQFEVLYGAHGGHRF